LAPQCVRCDYGRQPHYSNDESGAVAKLLPNGGPEFTLLDEAWHSIILVFIVLANGLGDLRLRDPMKEFLDLIWIQWRAGEQAEGDCLSASALTKT